MWSWYSLLLFFNQTEIRVGYSFFKVTFNCALIIIKLHSLQQFVCFGFRAGTSFEEFYIGCQSPVLIYFNQIWHQIFHIDSVVCSADYDACTCPIVDNCTNSWKVLTVIKGSSKLRCSSCNYRFGGDGIPAS